MAPTPPPNFGRSSFLVKKKTTKLIIKDVFLIKYWEVGVWGGGEWHLKSSFTVATLGDTTAFQMYIIY